MTGVDTIATDYVPLHWWVAAPVDPDTLGSTVELDWRPLGSSAWLACGARTFELCDLLRDCGALEIRQAGVRDGRTAVVAPLDTGWTVQLRASLRDGAVAQVGADDVSRPVGVRSLVGCGSWARPVYAGRGWCLRRLRAADVVAQWCGAGALPTGLTTVPLASADAVTVTWSVAPAVGRAEPARPCVGLDEVEAVLGLLAPGDAVELRGSGPATASVTLGETEPDMLTLLLGGDRVTGDAIPAGGLRAALERALAWVEGVA